MSSCVSCYDQLVLSIQTSSSQVDALDNVAKIARNNDDDIGEACLAEGKSVGSNARNV